MASVVPPALSSHLISAQEVNRRVRNRFEESYTFECRYNVVKYCKILLHKLSKEADIPYFALTGELWGVFCEYLWEDWRDIGTALY